MTNAEPTPVFRRFPSVQLVFCLACLGMTVWTWMRYSYAWDVTPDELWELKRQWHRAGRYPAEELYVQVPGTLRTWDDGSETLGHLDQSDGAIQVFRRDETPLPGTTLRVVLKGRLSNIDEFGGGYMCPVVDATASRFHPASIAGLVVGAMGCFIFGLYLRRWLVDRKALARLPGRDMID